ncbi:MAG: N-acetylmuramoyl-L-alanine amidase [Actinomycetota bacterium]
MASPMMRPRRSLAAVAAALALLMGVAAGTPAGRGRSSSAAAAVAKPRVVWKAIPFGSKRRRQMAAYSKRHYGAWRWRLVHPHVIVEHFTGGDSFSSAWNTFAGNSPDLRELPGTCAHFIVDRDGTIYQLVRLGTRCRHTVGLNYTAFGIEDVGTSDAAILGRPAQLRASLRLTLWLVAHYGIQIRDVIGHNESVMSPYHRELYESWRCQTHGDWNHGDMIRYRGMLKKLARKHGVPIGPPPHWVDPHC